LFPSKTGILGQLHKIDMFLQLIGAAFYTFGLEQYVDRFLN
jgi:hypothetical protein